MRSELLPFSPLDLDEDEIKEVIDVLRSGWITTGPKAQRFEAEFAARVSAQDAVAHSSCTAALHAALVALEIGEGDEVVTTPMTFASSVNAIVECGATPVLVDVQSDTLNLDPTLVRSALTERTRAILPVHYAGHPVDLDSIREIAEVRDLHVVEDAAHAFPASYRGAPIGSGANPTAFSFYATKNITTAEGGMLTGSPELLERVRTISLHGMDWDARKRYDAGGSWYYEVVRQGFKYNLPDLLAAVGIAQLRKVDGYQRRRREIVTAYVEAFSSIDALELPVERADVEHAWHLFVLRLNLEMLAIDRARFIDELRARNIATSVHFIPINFHPYYRDRFGWSTMDFPVSSGAYPRLISLPLSPALTDTDVADVIEAVTDVAATYRR